MLIAHWIIAESSFLLAKFYRNLILQLCACGVCSRIISWLSLSPYEHSVCGFPGSFPLSPGCLFANTFHQPHQGCLPDPFKSFPKTWNLRAYSDTALTKPAAFPGRVPLQQWCIPGTPVRMLLAEVSARVLSGSTGTRQTSRTTTRAVSRGFCSTGYFFSPCPYTHLSACYRLQGWVTFALPIQNWSGMMMGAAGNGKAITAPGQVGIFGIRGGINSQSRKVQVRITRVICWR